MGLTLVPLATMVGERLNVQPVSYELYELR
jgi:hypothetical protein